MPCPFTRGLRHRRLFPFKRLANRLHFLRLPPAVAACPLAAGAKLAVKITANSRNIASVRLLLTTCFEKCFVFIGSSRRAEIFRALSFHTGLHQKFFSQF